jgi:uncharacterized protein
MNILITGGTGYIGKKLTETLKENNHISIVSRSKKRNTENIQYVNWEKLTELKNIDVLINLAGENIGSSLWTSKKKQRILSSRIEATEKIKTFIEGQKQPLKLLVQGSAIGFYGYDHDVIKNEESSQGAGFLAEVVQNWEAVAKSITNVERTIFLRFGMVYSVDSILTKRLKPLINLYLGAIPGNGKNYISWIHINQLTKAVLFLMNHPSANGIFNIVRPIPETAEEFYQNLAKQWNRRIFFKIPRFLLKLILGDFAREVILANHKCIPEKLTKIGFKF